MYWLNSHGLQELEVISPGNGLTTAIQTDAVEYYHDSGVVSEYEYEFGTVQPIWCWLVSPQDRKISSVATLSVVGSEMFKRNRSRLVKGWLSGLPLPFAGTSALQS